MQALALHAHRRQIPFQAIQVSPGNGMDVAVEHGSAGALVLAPLLCDLVRERDGDFGGDLIDDLAARDLMGGIGVGVQ